MNKLLTILMILLISACAPYTTLSDSRKTQQRPPITKAPNVPIIVSKPKTPESDRKTAPPASTDEPFEPQYSTRAAPPQNGAVIALLAKASDQEKAGALDSAASSLERALRISPKDPLVYYRLANIRYLQDETAKAEQLAKRALSLDVANKRFQSQVWLLIAKCRVKTGDAEGAQEARQKAASLRVRGS